MKQRLSILALALCMVSCSKSSLVEAKIEPVDTITTSPYSYSGGNNVAFPIGGDRIIYYSDYNSGCFELKASIFKIQFTKTKQ